MRRQIAHQLAEVDAAFGRVIEDQPRAVEQLLDARQLHREAALADLQQADALRLLLALLVLQPRDDVLARRAAHDLSCASRLPDACASSSCGHAARDGAKRGPSAVWTTTASPGPTAGSRTVAATSGVGPIESEIGQEERLGAAGRRELDADERA